MTPLKTSYSAIQSFRRCPRAWYLGDVRRLVPNVEKRTGALGFGGRFHLALERWGEGTVDTPVEAWHQLMADEYAYAEEHNGLDSEVLDKENLLGLTMLDGYLEWHEEDGEDEEFEVVGVEHQLRNELIVYTPAGEEVEIFLYGKLDRILRHREFRDQFWVNDWKTTKNLEASAKESLEMSPQPRIYKALLEQEYPGMFVAGIRYTFFRKVLRTARSKPPFWFHYDLSMSAYNVQHHLNRVRALTGQMVEAVNRLNAGVPHEVATPFDPGWQCRACPFRNVCYVMQTAGMAAAEDMIENEFHEGDPLARYNAEAEQTVEVD